MKEENQLIKRGLIKKTLSQPIGPALNLQVIRLVYALGEGKIITKEEADIIRNEILAEIKEDKYPQTNLKSSSVTLVISKIIDLNFSRTKKKKILIALCPESSYNEDLERRLMARVYKFRYRK
jgi:Glu-tRNA(Gln) amidotransferase subunit E-like FAD-binding protein